MTPTPDIRPDQLRIVREILAAHLPEGVRVWVFGSRAGGDNRTWSDLDLAVEGPGGAVPEDALLLLDDAFEDSELSLRVDVVDLDGVSAGFRRVVESEAVPLPRAAG